MERVHCKCGSRPHAHFVKHVVDVHLDGSLADEEPLSNLAVREPSTDEVVDLSLTHRKRRTRIKTSRNLSARSSCQSAVTCASERINGSINTARSRQKGCEQLWVSPIGADQQVNRASFKGNVHQLFGKSNEARISRFESDNAFTAGQSTLVSTPCVDDAANIPTSVASPRRPSVAKANAREARTSPRTLLIDPVGSGGSTAQASAARPS